MFPPTVKPTIHFIGVTTGQSSIMRVFPRWAEALGLGDCAINGIDLPLRAPAEAYRAVVRAIKDDPMSRGALVTAHKLDLLAACRDLFDDLDPHARETGETSCLAKQENRLIGHALDPVSAGLALAAILPDGHFASGAEAFAIGAGGAATAITGDLLRRPDPPARLIVSDPDPDRLTALARYHRTLGATAVEYVEATRNDAVLATLAPGSLVINGSGLGKDRPGSPLTEPRFPADAIAWDLNYRGDLLFLAQARAAGVTAVDGWTYFLHGWTRAIATIFSVDIPPAGPGFERLSELARRN